MEGEREKPPTNGEQQEKTTDNVSSGSDGQAVKLETCGQSSSSATSASPVSERTGRQRDDSEGALSDNRIQLCPNCNAELDAIIHKFCHGCGRKIQQMIVNLHKKEDTNVCHTSVPEPESPEASSDQVNFVGEAKTAVAVTVVAGYQQVGAASEKTLVNEDKTTGKVRLQAGNELNKSNDKHPVSHSAEHTSDWVAVVAGETNEIRDVLVPKTVPAGTLAERVFWDQNSTDQGESKNNQGENLEELNVNRHDEFSEKFQTTETRNKSDRKGEKKGNKKKDGKTESEKEACHNMENEKMEADKLRDRGINEDEKNVSNKKNDLKDSKKVGEECKEEDERKKRDEGEKKVSSDKESEEKQGKKKVDEEGEGKKKEGEETHSEKTQREKKEGEGDGEMSDKKKESEKNENGKGKNGKKPYSEEEKETHKTSITTKNENADSGANAGGVQAKPGTFGGIFLFKFAKMLP